VVTLGDIFPTVTNLIGATLPESVDRHPLPLSTNEQETGVAGGYPTVLSTVRVQRDDKYFLALQSPQWKYILDSSLKGLRFRLSELGVANSVGTEPAELVVGLMEDPSDPLTVEKSLYDVLHDPHETVNRYSEEPDAAGEMQDRIKNIVGEYADGVRGHSADFTTSTELLDSSDIETMKAMGYL
jgi:hypothetical protein